MWCSVINMETVGQNIYQIFCFGMKRKNKRNCVSAAYAAQEQVKYFFYALELQRQQGRSSIKVSCQVNSFLVSLWARVLQMYHPCPRNLPTEGHESQTL